MRRSTLLIHISLMILASVIIVPLALLWVNLFARHGSSVKISDIYSLPESETEQLLDKARLRYEIIGSVYTTEVSKGAIYDLTPKAGNKVKAGRTIFITFNTYCPCNGIIPSPIDVSERQAWTRLINLGFEYIIPSYVAGFSDGLVTGVQSPSDQTSIPDTRAPLSIPFILLISVSARDSTLHGMPQPHDSTTGSGGSAIPSDSTSYSLEPDDDESWV